MIVRYLIAFFAGAFLLLSFSPFHFLPAAFISPLLFYSTLRKSSPKSSFVLGFLFGFGLMIFGVHWIYICIHQYGHASIFISLVALLLFTTTLALFYGALAATLQYLNRHNQSTVMPLLSFPACWVLFEWLRSITLSGFPWLLLGYSQVTSPLQTLTPMLGVYGMSFIVSLIAIAVYLMITTPSIRMKILFLLVATTPFVTAYSIKNVKWTVQQKKPIRVALLQGNIDQSIKWNPSFARATLNNYLNLIQQNPNAQIIILPEGAFPVWNTTLEPLLNRLNTTSQQKQQTLLIGIPYTNKKQKRYNAMIMLGHHRGTYFKRHLVPFGEYIPFYGLLSPIFKWINFGPFGYDAGPSQQPLLQFKDIKIAPFICYEIAYSREILKHSRNSGLIVVISDDSWYGQSIALDQQLEITQMRAQETGRYILASNSTGITAVISPQGHIIKSLPIDTRGSLTSTVYPSLGDTPITLYGYGPLAVICFMVLAFSLLKARSLSKKNKG